MTAFKLTTIAQNLASYNECDGQESINRRFGQLEQQLKAVLATARRALAENDQATYERARIAAKQISRQMDDLVAEQGERL